MLVLAGSCQSTAEGLQDQRDQIRANEDDRVRPWRKEGERCSVRFHDAAEREIDWRGDQSERNGETDELNHEVPVRDRKLVRDPALL
jgi:hypothetical protein